MVRRDLLRAGEEFFASAVGQDLLGKVASGQESHGAPPGYYFLLFWLTFWPGAALAALATPAVFAARREPAIKFLLAWLVPSWIVFELVVTKLPHYVLPLYPAIAILIAGVIDARTLSRARWLVPGVISWFLLPVAGGHCRPHGTHRDRPAVRPPGMAGDRSGRRHGLPGLAILPNRRRGTLAAARESIAGILIGIATFGLIVPSIAQLFPSVTLARILRDSGCREPVAAAAGYQEPSLVFLAGTSTELIDAAGAAEFLRGGECRFAFIEARQEKNFSQRAEAIGLRYTAGPRISAINIGTGSPITIAVYRSRGPL